MNFAGFSLDFEGAKDHLIAVAPIIGTCFAIPTLSDVISSDIKWYQIPLSRRAIFENWMHSPTDFRKGKRPWTLLTHIFCHVNEAHLINNAFAIFGFSKFVHTEFGAIGVWSTFLLGGVFSALDLFDHALMQARQEMFALPPFRSPSFGLSELLPETNSGLVGGIKSGLEKLRYKLVDTGAQATLFNTKFLGASGGAYALMGLDQMVMLERIASIATRIWQLRLTSTTRSELAAQLPLLSFYLFHITLTANNRFYTILQEWSAIHTPPRRGQRSGGDHIAHSSHVDGYLFGVGMYFVLRGVTWLLPKVFRSIRRRMQEHRPKI
eukprot:c8966_g1_i1.p1 GENE.c8966_g1_i1~~c8966_g1_i1.p1  ORF type:complete len:323 (-),score=60.43 c8966_g1_i1:126-1094(-)